MALIEVMEWDTSFFGFKVARLQTQAPEQMDEAERICREQRIRLLISRFDTHNVSFAHELEQHGGELMDTIVRYRLKLDRTQIPSIPGPATIRPCLDNEVDEVAAVASATFDNYGVGHFHQDARLDRDKCDALYVEWARNSCLDRNLADMVLVAEMDGRIVGFATDKIVGEGVGEGILFGTSPEARGKQIYRAFMVASMHWCASQGLERMQVATQVNNYAVQSVWASLGFRICASCYTFHKWF